jgi:hypothetical protein
MKMAQGSSAERARVLKRGQVVFGGGTAKVPVGGLPRGRLLAANAETGGEPEVNVVRGADGTIEQITLRCPCGRETTLQCEYPAQGEKDEDAAS